MIVGKWGYVTPRVQEIRINLLRAERQSAWMPKYK